jgi:hypothetical protein
VKEELCTKSDIGLLALKWATFSPIEDVRPASGDDKEIFDEIRAVLERHGALDRFGVSLLHRHFDLQENECLLESTDVETRRQVIEVVDVSMLDEGRVIETQWAFDGRGTVGCVGFCHYDKGHRHHHNHV